MSHFTDTQKLKVVSADQLVSATGNLIKSGPISASFLRSEKPAASKVIVTSVTSGTAITLASSQIGGLTLIPVGTSLGADFPINFPTPSALLIYMTSQSVPVTPVTGDAFYVGIANNSTRQAALTVSTFITLVRSGGTAMTAGTVVDMKYIFTSVAGTASTALLVSPS
jgi:hypothetical protein